MERTVDFDSVRMLALTHFGDKASPFMEDLYRMSATSQLTLAELTEKVAALDGDLIMRVDFSAGFPSHVGSYRGYYDQLAIGLDDNSKFKKSAAAFLDILRRADGQTFTGYKGGEFTMHGATPMWVAEYGECSNRAVVGLTVLDGGYAAITTTVEE